MRPQLLLFAVLALSLFCSVKSNKNFRLGRSRGGNLGIPFHHDERVKLPPAQWFEQKLDHFSPTDLRTWKQRYFVNDSFYDFEHPGPVFLMIGGEGSADARWMVKGAWIEYAKKFKALCIQLEHRYYGESHPTKDLSVKNLQYLSSLQALADLANFINRMNDFYKFNEDVKWIAFGGSYPGSLAAWLRLKYPHLVYAAVSSSGPLLAKIDFKGRIDSILKVAQSDGLPKSHAEAELHDQNINKYFEVVVNALKEKTGSEKCMKQIKLAHGQITEFMKTDPKVVEKEFRVCTSFSNATENDIKNFYNSIADDFAGVVQYNEDNRFTTAEKYRNFTINYICGLLTDSEDQPAYKKLALVNSAILEQSDQKCLEYRYQNSIDEMKDINWKSSEGGRQWMYQTCTEFGFYQTSSGEADVFGDHFTVDFYVQQCQDIFGRKYDKKFITSAIDWTNSVYGALHIPVSRVIFVHGSVDPWHALGITESRKDAPAIYIHGTAHCANMYPPSENDNTELVEARIKIVRYLESWLGIPHKAIN